MMREYFWSLPANLLFSVTLVYTKIIFSNRVGIIVASLSHNPDLYIRPGDHHIYLQSGHTSYLYGTCKDKDWHSAFDLNSTVITIQFASGYSGYLVRFS